MPVYGVGKYRVLLHWERPEWVVVNAAALRISEALLKGEGAPRVADALSEEYGVAVSRVLGDVQAVERQLAESGFLAQGGRRPLERIPEPRSLFLHLTHRCNLSCPHCYLWSRGPWELPTHLVFDLLDQLKALGGRSVTLSGGEPLLHPGFREIMDYARPELEIRLLTNGTLLNETWAGILAGHRAEVQVSVDGSCAEVHDAVRGQGSFEKAMRAISLLQEAGLSDRIHIAATAMEHNFHDLPRIIELARRLGVAAARFLPVRRRGTAAKKWTEVGEGIGTEASTAFYDHVIGVARGQEGMPQLSCGLSGFLPCMPEDVDDGVWCPVGRQLVVDAAGRVYPCAAMMTEAFLLGDVRRQGVEELFESAPMDAVCTALTRRRTRIETCSGCPWRNLCQSGCMAMALEHRGTIWETDDFCDYRKKLYTDAFDRILALSKERGKDQAPIPVNE